MAPRRIEECPRQRPHLRLAPLEGFRSEVLHGLARFLCRRRGRQWRAKRYAHGIRQVARQFPEEAAARKTENGAPHAVEVHWDDWNVDALNDAFHAAAERHHLADARHLPLGENADQLAVLQ